MKRKEQHSDNMISLQKLMATRSGTVNPTNFPGEVFELYSIPAFDRKTPDIVLGSEIGSSKQVVHPGDVLLSKIVPHIRRSWVVGAASGRRLIASGEWIVFRSSEFHSPYISQFLTSDKFHSQFMNTVSGIGGSLLRARPSHVGKIETPLPSLEDQKRIAYLLSKVEGLIAQRKQHLQQLDDLLKSVFLDMFGDPIRNEKGWDKKPFSELLTGIESGKSPMCEARPADIDEWGVLKLGAVTSCFYKEGDNKALPVDIPPHSIVEVKVGDVLFSRKNTYELVAACAYVFETRPKLLLPDLIFRLAIRDNVELNPIYLWQLLISQSQRRAIQSTASGAAGSMPNISKANLNQIRVPCPPILIQNTFAQIVSKIQEIKFSLQGSLDHHETLYAVIADRAFKSELDLSRVIASDESLG